MSLMRKLSSSLAQVSRKLSLSLKTSKVNLRFGEEVLRCWMKELSNPCCQIIKMLSMYRRNRRCFKGYV